MIDAIKTHQGPKHYGRFCPYYPYVRSDKKDEPRISITARLIADLLQTTGADRVMTMNLHSPQIAGFFRVPVDHLLAGRLLCKYYQESGIDNCVVVAPDAGSAKRAGHYAINLGLPLAILDKRRDDDSETPVIHHVIGEVKGKRALIFDDGNPATGGSILETVNALDSLGVKEIQACCVHAVLSGKAVERLRNSSLSKLVVTDTVVLPPEKRLSNMVVISVAELFAKAITCSHEGTSISGLFGPV